MKLPRRWAMGLAALLMAATLIATPRAGWSVPGHDYVPDPQPPSGTEGEPDEPFGAPLLQQGLLNRIGLTITVLRVGANTYVLVIPRAQSREAAVARSAKR
jgi:hypothetical protein